MSTPYHARYFAHELTRRHGPGGSDRLSAALFDACVDLNPHQIDATTFVLDDQFYAALEIALR